MEPVTHVLTGACLARTGLNRKAAYTTSALAIAAEFPDIDTLWSLRGPVEGFQHHRGFTHTFVGIPFEAAFLLLLFWLLHQWRDSRAKAQGAPRDLVKAPLRWGLLYTFIVLALLTHILLDYTNNYGVRPLAPFDSHWYAASIVFIFDPLLFALLLLGLIMPALFGLVGREVSGRREVFQGAGWARAALVAVVGFWGVRTFEHAKAVSLASQQTLRAPALATSADLSSDLSNDGPFDNTGPAPTATRPLLSSQQSLASPDPLNPFRWYSVTDFGLAYQLGTIDTQNGALEPGRILNKPAPDPMLTAAQRSRLGRVYLDWSPMPWITVTSEGPAASNRRLSTSTVLFQDPRFMGGTFLNHGSEPPLTGEVVLDANGSVLEEGMGDRMEP